MTSACGIEVLSCDHLASVPSVQVWKQWLSLCKVCFDLHVAEAYASFIKVATSTLTLCPGSAEFLRKPQSAQGLRQRTVLAPSRSLLRTRKAQIFAAPARVLTSNVRADGSVKAVAVDQPPTSTSSGGKEKVRVGINGEIRSCVAKMVRTAFLATKMLRRVRKNRSTGDSSSYGERRH